MKRTLALVSLLACAHQPAAQPVAVAPVPSSPPPLDPVARSWPLEAPDALVRVDVRALRATAVGKALARSAGALAQQLSGDRGRCFVEALSAVNDVVAGSSRAGWVAVVAFDPAGVSSPRACFPGDVAVATPSPGLLVAGTGALVARATAGGNRGDVLAEVAPRPHEIARGFVPTGDHRRVEATLALTDSTLALHADGEIPEPSERAAKELGAAAPYEIAGALRLLRPEVDEPTIDRLAHAFTLAVGGGHVEGAFALHEPGPDQARDASLLAEAAVQRYVFSSKEAEARSTVKLLARSLVAWWESAEPTPRKKKLVSFPAVPKDVPRGTTYASTRADWSAWAPLRFEIDLPQRYQYEIDAAKDGRSANVVARGDLDGDGKPSEFRMHVEVVRSGALEVSPSLVEINPDE